MRGGDAVNKADRGILSVTDYSKSVTHAVLFAARLFENVNLTVNLLNVYEIPDEKASILVSVEDILARDSEAGLKKQSAEIESVLSENSPGRGTVSISTHSLTGDLKKAIGAIIQTENINLIAEGIPANKYQCKVLNNIPLLFLGQSRFPVLMVPENCPDKPVTKILMINLGSNVHEIAYGGKFEHLVNHDHISKHIIHFNEKKIKKSLVASIQDILAQKGTDLLILIPAPGDEIDKLMLDYQIEELCPAVAELLNCLPEKKL